MLLSLTVTFFEEEPFFASPTACESISQVLPIPLPVSIRDQSNSSPHVVLPNPPSSPPLQTYQRRASLPTSNPPNIKGQVSHLSSLFLLLLRIRPP